MKTKALKQTVTLNATPREVYDILMDQKKHSAITDSTVSMSKKINGKFNAFDGYCHGYNIKLIEGEKIVQAWHFDEDGWPEDHFSICTFELKKIGEKTKLTFTQTEIPEHKVDSLKEGWKNYYWNRIKEYLKNTN
jgi:activator of HSP90 ATPase